MKLSQIQINPEYRDIVPPLTPEEFKDLKESVQKDGLYYPIIVNQDCVLLDGHHRYKVCKELGIEEPKTDEKKFDHIIQEKLFVVHANLKRRHLTDSQKIMVGLRIEPILREAKEWNEKAKIPKKGEKGFQKVIIASPEAITGSTDELVSQEIGMSRATYQRGRVVKKNSPDLFKQVENRELTIGQAYNKYNKETKKQEAKDELLKQKPKIKLPEGVQVIPGDFIEKSKNIPDNSIDLIFTDPPYVKKSLPVYDGLAQVAQRVLKDGGSLITYLGQGTLPEVIERIQQNSKPSNDDSKLNYWWIICMKHTGAHSQMFQKKVFVHWKPLLWFVKGKINEGLESINDYIESEPPNKDLHEWAQSPKEAEHIISKLTVGENQIVFDPFMGSGTTGIAATNLKRKFIGIELDSEKFKIAKASLIESIVRRDSKVS